MARPYAEQLADYSARRAALEDEGRPQSFRQWSELEADRRAWTVTAKYLGNGRSVVAG